MSQGGHPIACPFLREYAAEAEAIPAKARKAHGAPKGGVEINHWLSRILDLAQKASERPSGESEPREQGRYEVTRKRALRAVWDAYSEVQAMADNLSDGKYEVTESYGEVRQRAREGIAIVQRDIEDL